MTAREAWTRHVRADLATQQKRAEGWRNGLSAFLTLLLSALVLSGRDTISSLVRPAQFVVAGLFGLGLLLAVAGLWATLSAQFGGKFVIRTWTGVPGQDVSIETQDARVADQIVKLLRLTRMLVGIGIVLLIAGALTSWLALPATPSPLAYLQITQNPGTDKPCGRLSSADGGQLRLKVPGQHDLTTIPFAQVRNLTLVASCP